MGGLLFRIVRRKISLTIFLPNFPIVPIDHLEMRVPLSSFFIFSCSLCEFPQW